MLNLKRNYDEHIDNLSMSKKYIPFQWNDQDNLSNKESKSLKKKQSLQLRHNKYQIKNIYDLHNNKLNDNLSQIQQQHSRQIHRYLKEYQYNIYLPDNDNENNQNNSLNNVKLGSKQICKDQVKKDLQQKTNNNMYDLPQSHYSLNNLSSNNNSLQSKQMKRKINQNKENILLNFINQPFCLVTNTNLNFNNNKLQNNLILHTKNEKQSFISKEEIVLLKHLREQNNQLKLEISKKNCYILELQQKLQNYLKQRIQHEKQTDQLCQSLQQKLSNAQNEIKTLQQQIINHKQTEIKNQKTFSTILKQLNLSQKQNNIPSQQLPKTINLLQQILTQKNIIDEFVHKIEEMKIKIESKSNKNQYCLKKDVNNTKDKSNIRSKPVNLKQLWKWLKRIAKQYEVMKEKVISMQKEQNFSQL